MIPATWNEVSSWTQLKHRSNSFPYFILLQQKTHSALFGLGFASVHSFLRGRNLRETAGLDSDPCTCSCENPMQGYLGCVYMQILVSSRQLSHSGQWTVQQICISIPNILFCHIYSNITCCILRTWRIITFGTVWYSKLIWRVTLYHFYWSVNSLFKQGTLVECQICAL